MDLFFAAIAAASALSVVWSAVAVYEMKTRGLDHMHISEHPAFVGAVMVSWLVCFGVSALG